MAKALLYINPLRVLARWRHRPARGKQGHAHRGHCCGFPGAPECCMTERKG